MPSNSFAQQFDIKVVDDLLHLHFERTYQGKVFSDVGKVEDYDQSIMRSGWYVEINSPDTDGRSRRVYCIIATSETDPRLTDLKARFPVGARVRMTGKMAEWNTNDSTLRLDDFCEIKN